MSLASLARKSRNETADPKPRGNSLRISEPGDLLEREADRAAAEVSRGERIAGWSLSKVSGRPMQRQDSGALIKDERPKPQSEQYKEAASKLGEAFLKTEVGKKLEDAAKQAGEEFISTLPGKVIAGTAAVGAVTALAATHSSLPVQLPEIPLDKIHPGLKVKLTYEGPLDHPTKALVTFSYAPKPEKKSPLADSERYRAETARIAADQAKFRAGMRYTPGSPQDLQQKAEDKAIQDYLAHRYSTLPGFGDKPLVPAQTGSTGTGPGLTLPRFESPFKLKAPTLFDQKLELKPFSSGTVEPGPEKKEEPAATVQRKAADSAPEHVSAEVLPRSAGRPLDRDTRAFMESKFGFDFSKVRVHTDASAAASAKAVNALAYTVGSDLVFSTGQYSPYTGEGRKLLAHELAHAIQQNGVSAAPAVQRKCACGGLGGEHGECEECKEEQTTLQRHSAVGPEPATVPPIVYDVLRSPGQPLDAEARALFEPRLGHDFSRVHAHTARSPAKETRLTVSNVHEASETEAELLANSMNLAALPEQTTFPIYDLSRVRIHADQRASESAQAVNALAYTVGRDVVFGAGQYAPHTSEGRKLLAHELTHVVQQAKRAPAHSGPGAIQRKVVLNGTEMSAKDRRLFLKAHKWTSGALAASVMEEMAAAGDAFDFADENELETEINKRLSTVRHIEESQRKIPGDKRSAFGYPFTGASGLYGPRVNYAAREYWEPAVPDHYAVRRNRAKNKELRSKPRHERCTVYGDPCGDYGWKLSEKGKKDPYHAIALLFRPQPPHKRTLIHCDYLISLVNFMSLADSIGLAEFNKRVAAFGADRLVLRWNAFDDLHLETFERTPSGDFGSTVIKGLGSTQRIHPSSKADLVIGDHVVFNNHIAYDLINEKIGNAWRLENAVFVARRHGKDVFLGHGSGYKTDEEMRKKLAEEFNKVADQALTLIAMTRSSNLKTQGAGSQGIFDKFPHIHPVGPEWHIQGTNARCPSKAIDKKLTDKKDGLKPSDVPGLKNPCDPTEMYPVERPIESAK